MHSRRALSGSQFAAILVLLAILATAPFVLAAVLDERRISSANAYAARLAEIIRQPGTIEGSGAVVLVGPGKLPTGEPSSAWFRGTSASLSAVLGARVPGGLAVDPWQQAYIVNIGARGPVWVISVDANGILETPFDGALAPGGDDIAARVR